MNYRSILIAAVQTLGLFVAGLIIPLLGQVVALLTPVPLILISVRNGMLHGYLSLIIAGVVMTLLGGWHAGAVLVLSFGLMAVGVSEGMRRQWKPESASLLGGMLPVIVLTVVIAYFFSRLGKNPASVIEEYFKSSVGETAKLYGQLGFKEMADAVTSVSDTFIYYLVRLIPGITIATSVFQAAFCYGLSRSILLKRPGNAPAITGTTLAQWHAPDIWVWGLIVGLGLSMMPNETARFTGWNLAIIYAVVYLTQGVAIVDHYLRKARIRPFTRWLIHTLILVLPSVVFVIALGIVDIWADFRKVRGPVKAA